MSIGSVELAYSSIKCFTDDGTLDVNELNFLLGMALRDNNIDEDEKRVLNSIFNKVSESQVSRQTWARMQAIREEYSI